MFKTITLKQEKFSKPVQSWPAKLKKLRPDPVLIRPKLASVLIRAHLW